MGEKCNHVSAGQLLKGLLVVVPHEALKVLAHRHDAARSPAIHDRLLERGEAAPAHDHDDDVVEGIGLGLYGAAAVVLAKDRPMLVEIVASSARQRLC